MSDKYTKVQIIKDEHVDLFELVKFLYSQKVTILITTVFAVLIATLVSFRIPDMYKASLLLSANTAATSSISKLASQFGNIASFAGIDLGIDSGEDKVKTSIRIIKSWHFLDNLIKDENLAPLLIAVKMWDREANQIIYDDEIYDLDNQEWRRTNLFGELIPPTSWELFKTFEDLIIINEDDESGVIELSIEHQSPTVAREILYMIIDSINNQMKIKDQNQSLESINYLRSQIEATNVAEMQQVFYELIEEQTKTLMLTEITKDYVFQVVGHAMLPEEKSRPNRLAYILLGFFAGIILSVLIIAIRYFIVLKQD